MIIYLVKSFLLLGVLYGLYKLLLENEKTHRFNRFFLLFALVFGLTAPLISFEVSPEQSIAGIKMQQMERLGNAPAEAVSKSVESAIISEPATTATSEIAPGTPAESGWSMSTTDILLGLYGLITLFLLIRFAGGLIEIRTKIKNGSHKKIDNATLVLLNEPVTPQSFFRFIFLNKEQFESGKIESEILDHELTHVRQLHSLDVLLIEFLKVLFWFNPLMYLYKHAIQLNHEFLADESVVSNGSSVTNYQNMLIRVCAGNKSLNTTTSSISYSLTKKRLKMMVKKFSALRSGSKGIFLIPILLTFTMMFCTQSKEDGFTKITNYNEEYYSKVNLYTNYERSKELGLENEGPGIRFDSAGNPFTGVHQIRHRKNDRLAFEAVYENGVLKSNTRYNAEGDTLASYSFGVIGGKFRTVREYNQNGMLVEKWTNPQSDDSIATIKQWHPNGQLKYKAHYKGDLQFEGLMTLYDEQGNILEQERYEDGELIETIK